MSSAKNKVVLDASAVLAVVRVEPGHEHVSRVMARSLISAVNEAEVLSVLIQRGDSAAEAIRAVLSLPYTVVDVDRQLARRAGALWKAVKPRGLSLGDRCCIALAEREGLPAMTSDARWADLRLGIEVQLFR